MSRDEQACPRPVVHIIDDDVALGEGLANLLRSADFEVALFHSPTEFINAFEPSSCGCLLLDIRFPEGSGLDFQDLFLSEGIAVPVILMTGHADVPSSVRGMKAGAVDFLTKPFEDEELLGAVAIALERDAVRREREMSTSAVSEQYATLTSREREVMALVVTGLMNKQVAGELNLSEITVKVHRGTMMRKMKVRTLADLVRASEVLNSMPKASAPAAPVRA